MAIGEFDDVVWFIGDEHGVGDLESVVGLGDAVEDEGGLSLAFEFGEGLSELVWCHEWVRSWETPPLRLGLVESSLACASGSLIQASPLTSGLVGFVVSR